MNKKTRLAIVIAVMLVAFFFLLPSLQWYFGTTAQDKSLALLSLEGIRDYSRRSATKDLETLLDRAQKGDNSALDATAYRYFIAEAKAQYKKHKQAQPSQWTAQTVLAAFNGPNPDIVKRDITEAIESRYRKDVLSLKKLYTNSLKLGLDLSGGLSVVINADLGALEKKLGRTLSAADKDDAMKRALEILNGRIDRFGLTEPVIRRQGDSGIYVEIPGSADPEVINSVIMGRGGLAFYIVNDELSNKLAGYLAQNPLAIDEKNLTVADTTLIPAGFIIRKVYTKDSYGIDQFTGNYLVLNEQPGLDGNHVQSAQVTSDNITGAPETNFILDKEGGSLFYDLTSKNVQKRMAVVLDDRIKASATIQEPIREQVRLSGFSATEAQNIATLLRTAALPVELSVANQQAIGASLGEDAISQGKLAIVVGLLAVLVFMFIFYKGAGLNAILAQVLNLYIMVSVLTAFHLTLTLASIAGFVLTVGMAVDANVVVFERIKEELRLGKSRRASIEAGFGHAFWAIMDSNITTIIAALFLSQLGSGTIQGFAISLAIGNITSLFTALFVSRLIFDFQTDVIRAQKVSISWRIA